MILYILVSVIILALFLYSKLTPYRAKLTGRYMSAFLFSEKIFEPILNLLRKIAKPAKVGNGIAMDMSQIVLLILFLILLKFV